MKNVIKLTAAAAILAISTPVFASSNGNYCAATSGNWMSKAEAISKAAKMGYDVRRIKREDGCYEVYAIGKNGARLELYLNPVTGKVVKIKNKS